MLTIIYIPRVCEISEYHHDNKTKQNKTKQNKTFLTLEYFLWNLFLSHRLLIHCSGETRLLQVMLKCVSFVIIFSVKFTISTNPSTRHSIKTDWSFT